MTIDPSAEILRLRATVRDLLALSTIPEAWVGREPPAIAADLADLLIGSFELDFAFVRLRDPTGCQVVEVTRGNSWKAFPQWLQQHLAAFGQISRKEVVTNVGGVEESCCGIVIPIGVNSERGLVAAASDRSDFSDQIDQQLLSVAANNAATAFQNAFLINELRSAQEALRANERELRKARDESEMKVAERTADLRRSERELRDVLNSIPSVVWSALPDGSNTYVNSRWVEYSGLPAVQTGGSGWHAATHPDDLERHNAKWLACVASGEPFEDEVRFRRADGEYRWHLVRGVPLGDEAGNIVKWYGVVTDIEDRKRAEVALQLTSRDLQESKSKLEEAQRITHVGYWEWDVLTGRVNWSDETYRIYGLRPQEPPMDLDTVRKKIHPEDWGGVSRALDEALGGGARYNAECRVFRPTGEVRIIHSQGDVKRDTAGRPTLMFGTVQDITDRKRAEDKIREQETELRQILDFTPQHIAVFGPDGTPLYANHAALDYFGVDIQRWRAENVRLWSHSSR
jgi:PAS domain S-box-containing protein